ncbi:MAG: hypothetical protein ACYTGZ_03525 [Planctomycetota bacterium]|jgi:biopolymer transport protein ExbD
MRVARSLLKNDRLFLPGWIAAVIGTVIVVVLFVVMGGLPFMRGSASVLPGDLPVLALQAPPATYEDLVHLYVPPRGAVYLEEAALLPAERLAQELERLLSAQQVGVALIVNRTTAWPRVRDVVRTVRESGALRIDIRVRNADGTHGSIILDPELPLPELADDADAQAFVDALAARTR